MEDANERRTRWLEAASALTLEPGAQVLCPDCGKSFLTATDEQVDASHVDRHICCAYCGARESIFLKAGLKRIQ